MQLLIFLILSFSSLYSEEAISQDGAFSPAKSHSFFERKQTEKAIQNSYTPQSKDSLPKDELDSRFYTSGSTKTRNRPQNSVIANEQRPTRKENKYEFKTNWIPSNHYNVDKSQFEQKPIKATPPTWKHNDSPQKFKEFDPEKAFTKSQQAVETVQVETAATPSDSSEKLSLSNRSPYLRFF
ncbi:uncharacterized protein MONOS_5995 [Monocercomonoides exilis]|uniref:uncharacterized protein n=1 Tax=Monocercomonoides exilis TaxID=2049356 RepID=UPI00355A4A84|nr:hypothetical protein MONOS_5995 [Monocercomonoides exilis]|eukprot:MONOS_5995.1-p1 / transcript=MONOS_5995.1 / gene=MONOS_5995 / organism=Monocercomonoides_exilis_PA203 / gene_product=unspecified product / transcript_product=unspecified product / location=Mono_scaffold00182:66120-66796(+) / protein_length=182 / sequence_SO=supercontig / SO=protein_coding / is_pseudo=false